MVPVRALKGPGCLLTRTLSDESRLQAKESRLEAAPTAKQSRLEAAATWKITGRIIFQGCGCPYRVLRRFDYCLTVITIHEKNLNNGIQTRGQESVNPSLFRMPDQVRYGECGLFARPSIPER